MPKRYKKYKNFGKGGKHDRKEQKVDRDERIRQIDAGEIRETMRDDYKSKLIQIGSEIFDEYYLKQFVPKVLSNDEFAKFKHALTQKLPVTYRLNPSVNNYKQVG